MLYGDRMRLAGVLLSGVLLLHCAGSAARPSAASPPAAPPGATAASAPPGPMAPAPAASSAAAPAPKPAAAAGGSEAGALAPAATVPAACRGAALDLDLLGGRAECTAHDVPRPPPAPSELELTAHVAPRTVAPGASAVVTLTMKSHASGPLALDVDLGCGGLEAKAFAIDAFDARGRRLDALDVDPSCATSQMCTRRTLHVVLDPGGSATSKFPFRARLRPEDCGSEDATLAVLGRSQGAPPAAAKRALPRGRYTLRVKSGLRDARLASGKETQAPRTADAIFTVR